MKNIKETIEELRRMKEEADREGISGKKTIADKITLLLDNTSSIDEAVEVLRILSNKIEDIINNIEVKPEPEQDTDTTKIDKEIQKRAHILASLCLDITGVYKGRNNEESEVSREGMICKVYFSLYGNMKCITIEDVTLKYAYEDIGKTVIEGTVKVNVEVFKEYDSLVHINIYDGREVEGSELGLPIVMTSLNTNNSEGLPVIEIDTLIEEIISLEVSKYEVVD